jgi:DHA2 family multidrug resistance protein
VVAAAMWHMTSLTPAADFDYFVWARVFQMIGLPLLFIPINSAAYAGLPPDSTNQASALINVARNLGGSIGVSLANTEIAQRSQFHQARLVEHVTSSSLSYFDTSHRMTDYFTAQGAGPVAAGRAALAWIGQAVQNQATLLAYGDAFWVAALFAALMVPLVLLMLRPIDMRVGVAAH